MTHLLRGAGSLGSEVDACTLQVPQGLLSMVLYAFNNALKITFITKNTLR